MTSLIEVMGLYHNYQEVVELVLEFYCEMARRTLCYLVPSDSRILYERSISVIQMYALHNQGKRSVGKESEEDQFKDILLLMELLTNLLSKDFIDLSPQDSSADTNDEVTAAEVCLYGLKIIMPLMTLELLRFPSLCLQYFKTTTLICEVSRSCQRNDRLFYHGEKLSSKNSASRKIGVSNRKKLGICSQNCPSKQYCSTQILNFLGHIHLQQGKINLLS